VRDRQQPLDQRQTPTQSVLGIGVGKSTWRACWSSVEG
jgi:hypothetical protein